MHIEQWDVPLYSKECKNHEGEGQGSLVCCSPRGRKESDRTDCLNNKTPHTTKWQIVGLRSSASVSFHYLLVFLAQSFLIPGARRMYQRGTVDGGCECTHECVCVCKCVYWVKQGRGFQESIGTKYLNTCRRKDEATCVSDTPPCVSEPQLQILQGIDDSWWHFQEKVKHFHKQARELFSADASEEK